MNARTHGMWWLAVVFVAVGFYGGCRKAEVSATKRAVSLDSELSLMSDPAGFAALSKGRTGFISTYDRTGGNMDWGNWDPSLSVDGQHTLADIKGPGCLTRIWTTGCEVDEWRVYVDDDTDPRIRGRGWGLFGSQEPFVPPVADQFSGAAYTYLTVPFSKRLRVAVYAPKIAAGARPYYHVGYESLPPGTPVTSYPRSLSDADRAAIAKLREAWDSVEAQARDAIRGATWKSVVVQPGATAALEEVKGAGTIRTFAVRIKGVAGMPVLERPRVLRKLVLECRWDDAAAPSVQVPLGDFFCNGLAFRSFASLPLANVDGAFVCRFPMPFRSAARIGVRNDGGAAVTIESWARCDRGGDPGTAAAPMYLHASWNCATSLGVPFQVMRADGNGQYVGCYLISQGTDGTWSILEGDEAFFIDGETTPVWHGTGLEDYFNAGWYYYGLSERALHGLLEKAAMRTAQYRFHVSDPVRFRKSLQMTMEFGDANRARGYMSAAAYWYQDRPAAANSSIPGVGDRFPQMEKVAVTSVMSELFELEKAGLIQEAVERCRHYEALFAGSAYGPMYGLRGLAYKEAIEGNLSVRALYAAVASRTDVPAEVAAQARLLHWAGDGPNRAIIGGHAAGAWRLYWDGRLVGEGNSPFEFKAFPLEVTPGEHWIQAEVTPRTPGAFFSACLRTAFTNVTTDMDWVYVQEKPAGWPNADGTGWKRMEPMASMFPQMGWWQFAPNAFVGMQHSWQVIYPYAGWDNPPGRTVYLRRRVLLPAEMAGKFLQFPRRKEIRAPALRPAGDTSNEGMTK